MDEKPSSQDKEPTMTIFSEAYRGKRVMITGLTGFKGRWLGEWLRLLGAKVYGFGQTPVPSPYGDLPDFSDRFQHVKRMDVRSSEHVRRYFLEVEPEVVFHLAAQPLVRHSYQCPTETFDTNVMGLVHVLESSRDCESVRAVVNVTSDRCYENKEWHWAYREDEPMGGHDPYSASKGCAELVTASFRRSYFEKSANPVGLASGRAGNVIGGGDWSEDRLVPDIVRAVLSDAPIVLRRPDSIRPWQHVLEALCGYLQLGSLLLEDPRRYSSGWNFGPSESDATTVRQLANQVVDRWQRGTVIEQPDPQGLHEAKYLKLDSSKARNELYWAPLLSAEERVQWTIEWYKDWAEFQKSYWTTMSGQIEQYQERWKRWIAKQGHWSQESADSLVPRLRAA